MCHEPAFHVLGVCLLSVCVCGVCCVSWCMRVLVCIFLQVLCGCVFFLRSSFSWLLHQSDHVKCQARAALLP